MSLGIVSVGKKRKLKENIYQHQLPLNYCSRLADDAEEGVKRHNLRSVFRTVRKIATSPSHHHSSNGGDVPMIAERHYVYKRSRIQTR